MNFSHFKGNGSKKGNLDDVRSTKTPSIHMCKRQGC